MDKRLERILPRVQKPARYVGGEYNAILKDKAAVDTRIAFCFPDTYEIGMSNLGMRILYGVMNNIPGVWCERVFAPWGDMEAELRQAEMPLFALESGDPITDYDIVAFSVGYEMAFPAILNMLDLAHIPSHAADRTGLTPLVIAGGTAMYNAGSPGRLHRSGQPGRGRGRHRGAGGAPPPRPPRGLEQGQFSPRRCPTGRYLCPVPLRCDLSRRWHRGVHHAP